MKLSDCVIDCPLVGECKIDLDKCVKCFGETTLSSYHDKFRLTNYRANVKISISKEDAIELIRRLDLVKLPSYIFAYAAVYRRKTSLEKLDIDRQRNYNGKE